MSEELDKKVNELHKARDNYRKIENKIMSEIREERSKIDSGLVALAQEQEKDELRLNAHLALADGIDTYYSDDYAGLEIKIGRSNYRFYFGYERTVDEYEDDEWCFCVTKNNKEIMVVPQSRLHPSKSESPIFYLLRGMAFYLKGKKQ